MKKALLIGLNYSGGRKLNGCINDIHETKALLAGRGFTSFTELTDDGKSIRPTKSAILSAMRTFTSSVKSGDLLAVFFSGHGGQCGGSKDEKDRVNECIYSADFEIIVDDDIKASLIDPLPEGAKLYLHFDSCHSGSVADLPYNYIIPQSRSLTGKSKSFKSSFWKIFDDEEIEQKDRSIDQASVLPEYNLSKPIKATVMLVSGCKDYQSAADDFFEVRTRKMQAEGAMSHFFRDALYETKDPTFYDVFCRINQRLIECGYPQRSQMSGTDPTLKLLREKFWF